jgi:hypothetical protein
VKAGSNICAVTLPVVEGDEKGTQYPGVKTGNTVSVAYKTGDLALQVGTVSNLRQ